VHVYIADFGSGILVSHAADLEDTDTEQITGYRTNKVTAVIIYSGEALY
jgi:hypothetical protein